MLKVEKLTRIEESIEKSLLWNIYKEAFGNDTICTQDQMCYDEDSFNQALMDTDYLKWSNLN